MTNDPSGIRDGVACAMEMSRGPSDLGGIWGEVTVELWDKDGNLKAREVVKNLVTDVGDRYYADRAAQILGSTVPVTAITNATTAVVTTTGAHGFGVGDRVILAGITPTLYNGSWAITAVGSATTFSIYVGTVLGALTVAGTAQGLTLAPAAGMKLGTGSTAVAKNGAGAALVTYLTNSHQAFDSTYPQSSAGTGRVITYKVTYAAGKATSAGTAITEVVIFLDFLADATSSAANSICRAILAGIGSKQATDTLTTTWTHSLLGS